MASPNKIDNNVKYEEGSEEEIACFKLTKPFDPNLDAFDLSADKYSINL
ncbi:Uncharacterised protein [Mycoplasmopsis arginini]|nr:Uncharacterised protein [Chlamydia trachomatis]SGA02464.1 Uncharacterised protein [Chlamydia abortus]SGA12934.1 Uncharacterised protein [Mycoplasmopsis arginini]CRH47271.1 Uncharacterised protein [Chlamydia trachomatis]CRH55709.1 Uncharacterised protein [Chlamydia trachomatis]